jgi:gluconolactonase
MPQHTFTGATASAYATSATESPGQATARWPMSPVRYPDPAIRVLDPRFAKYRLGNAAVERLATGFRWAEGPVWFGDGRYLLFSDIPNNRIMRWLEETGELSVFRSPSQYSNGHTRDKQGRLISCEHDTRRVTRTEYDGSITVLMDHFQGKPLNAPNDVVVKSDGSIWFTDPGYGIMFNYEGHRATLELPAAVYRLDLMTQEATVAIDDMSKPNGLCFSPNESLLYVVDSGSVPRVIRVYDVVGSTHVANGRRFVDMSPGTSDGIRCDVDGNLWAAAGDGGDGFDGVHIFARNGDRIGQILLPEKCANVCFGGAKRNRRCRDRHDRGSCPITKRPDAYPRLPAHLSSPATSDAGNGCLQAGRPPPRRGRRVYPVPRFLIDLRPDTAQRRSA